MVIIDPPRLAGFKVREAYFPTADEVWRLAEELPPFTTVRARQAGELARPHRRQIKHNPTTTLVADLTRPADEVFGRMSKSTRNLVSRARRTPGVRVAMNGQSACSDFLTLHNEFVAEKRFTGPLSHATLNAHLAACDVAVAYLDDDPICGLVVLRDPTVRRALPVYSATTRLRAEGDYDKHAGRLYRYLFWHLMQHYQAAGMELFDFGGIWSENDSIGQFKRSLGGEPLHEHNYAFAGPLVHLALRVHRLPAVQAVRMRFA
jgi:hypothetical protein